MEKVTLISRIMLSVSISALALALIYFSYSINNLVTNLPKISTTTIQASQSILAAAAEVEKIQQQIPDILAESEQIRLTVPLVTDEVQATRKALPNVVQEISLTRQEVQAVREQLPEMLKQLNQVQQSIPDILSELALYRALIPDILADMEKTREFIPPTLDRVDELIVQADQAGRKASEGAVTGIFTGIIKAPFKLAQGIGNNFFADHNLTKNDLAKLAVSATELLGEGKVGQSERFTAEESGVKVQLTLNREFFDKGRLCREILYTAKKNQQRQRIFCVNADNEWQPE